MIDEQDEWTLGHTSQKRYDGANICAQVDRVCSVFAGDRQLVKVVPKCRSDAVGLSFPDDQALSGVQYRLERA